MKSILAALIVFVFTSFAMAYMQQEEVAPGGVYKLKNGDSCRVTGVGEAGVSGVNLKTQQPLKMDWPTAMYQFRCGANRASLKSARDAFAFLKENAKDKDIRGEPDSRPAKDSVPVPSGGGSGTST